MKKNYTELSEKKATILNGINIISGQKHKLYFWPDVIIYGYTTNKNTKSIGI